MSSTQVVLVVLGVIIFLSSFVDIRLIKNLFTKTKDKTPDEPYIKPQVTPEPYCQGSIACVVEKWEELKKCCDGRSLKQASSKLNDVFPLFLSKEEKDVNN